MITSLIGLGILLVFTFENLALLRKKTAIVMFLDQLFASVVVYMIFGWITLIYSVVLSVFLIFIRYKKDEEGNTQGLDYSGRILSVSAILNKLRKPKELVIGRILPTNRHEIEYNLRTVELDQVVLSGATLITGSTGSGKNLHKDTLIPTSDGIKRLKDICINDKIFDKNGKLTTVIDKYSPEETKFYRFTLSDGTVIDAGGGHLWEVILLKQAATLSNADADKLSTKIMTSNEIAEYLRQNRNEANILAIHCPKSCEYPKIQLPIKPYWFGAWLCDGSKWEACIFNTDTEMQDRLIEDYPCRKITHSTPRKEGYQSIITWYFYSDARKLLTANNLRGNKYIPDVYKIASIDDKLNLLAGTIDTEGSVSKNGECRISLTNKQVIESLREICCSLGFKCSSIKTKTSMLKKDNGKIVKCSQVWSFAFYPTMMLPLQVSRKRDNLYNKTNIKQQIRHNRFYIKSVEEINGKAEDYFCLAVDSPTHMFLCTDSYVPTHNTTTMKTILKQRIDEHKPVVFFDYKGENDILDELQSYAENAGLSFYEFSARKCNFTYDPFINLNETGKVEALMNTRRWSTDGADEHYKTSMQLAIQNLVRKYDQFRQESNEKTNYIVGLYNFSRTYKYQSNERDGFVNLQKSLEILLSSKAIELFGNDPSFTFESDEPFVVCFSFTSANKALANSLSSFVYTDIMDRGTRKHYIDKLLLCVDEFGTLESSTIIKDLLEKGRSGGVQTVFSILDVNQIAMNAGEHFVQAILGTINNYIIHAGATQQTAELLAGVQKFDKSFDIMSLRKPYRGKEPTALFVSKYPIFSKKGNQDVYRIIPYTKVLKTTNNKKTSPKSALVEASGPIEAVGIDKNDVIDINTNQPNIPVEELDLTQPIDNIDQYL